MSLIVKQVSVAAKPPASRVLLHGMEGAFRDGRITLLVGPSGAGKSTLLQTLAGLLPPQSGTVEIDGMSVYRRGRGIRQALLKLAYVEQFPEDQLFASSVLGEIRYSLRPYGLSPAEQTKRVELTLTRMGVDRTLWSTSPLTLSGGLKRRLAIASSLATDAAWLLFDEPTAGLDAPSRKQFVQFLAESRQNQSHGGVILATHDIDELLPLADDIWILQEGQLHGVYTVAELLDDPDIFRETGIGVPESVEINHRLRQLGFQIPTGQLQPAEVASAICAAVTRGIHGAHNPDASSGEKGQKLTSEVLTPDLETERIMESGPAALLAGTWLQRTDPRAKWVFFLCLTLGLFLQRHWAGLMISTVVLIVCTVVARLNPTMILRTMRPVYWMMSISVLLSACTFHPYPNRFFGINTGPVQISLHRAETTLRGALEFGVAVGIGILIPATISRVQMKGGLEQLLRGWWRIGVPVEALSLSLTLILRFLPMLRQEVERFARIAQARGKVVTRRDRLSMRTIPSAIIPLILSILRLGEDLSMALEARGLRDFGHRGNTETGPSWKGTDWLTACVAIVMLAGLWFVR